MNADELDALLDGLPEEVTSVSKQSSVASRQGPPQPPPPRFPRFAKFGIHASPTTGEESETASVAVSNALRKRPPRVSAGEWVFALQKAQNFEHANARRGADRFLTLPTGPRLRYHVWGDKKDDQGDLIDILLLHDLGEAGGGFADLGVALARRGYRVFAPDFRGHGDSDRARPYNTSTLVEDLRSFAVELDLYRKPFILCGFGLGGLIGLAFTAVYGQLVGGLIVCDADPCFLSSDQYNFHPTQAARFDDVQSFIDTTCSPDLLELVETTGAFGARRDPTKALPRLRHAIRDDRATANGDAKVVPKMDDRWCFQTNGLEPRAHAALVPRACPVRFLSGERSGVTSDSLAACLPVDANFLSYVIPGAGSRVLEDRSRETRDTILDCVLHCEGAIAACDVSKRTPEALGDCVKALQKFDTIAQAIKALCVRAPPTNEAIEMALTHAREWDEAPSEDDEERTTRATRQTALAKDDQGYFGYIG